MVPLCDLKMILCPAVGSGPLENTQPHRCCTFFEMTVFAEKPPHPLASSNPLPTDTVNQQLLSWVVDETARKKSARFSIEAILEVCWGASAYEGQYLPWWNSDQPDKDDFDPRSLNGRREQTPGICLLTSPHAQRKCTPRSLSLIINKQTGSWDNNLSFRTLHCPSLSRWSGVCL